MAGPSGECVLAEGPAHVRLRSAFRSPRALPAGCPPALAAMEINARPEALGSRPRVAFSVTIDIVMDPARTPPPLT